MQVSQPGDPLEREADYVADKVMKMPRQPLSAQLPSPSSGNAMPSLSEPYFGHDLSRPWVHTHDQAPQEARTARTRHYGPGPDIVFGPGEYSPATTQGGYLLAHELGHVTQQRTLGSSAGVVQRQAVTGTTSRRHRYEAGGTIDRPSQVRTDRVISGVSLALAYDPGTAAFAVTFPLVWIFPHAWSTAQRLDYVQRFEAAVRRVWDGRFLLTERARPHRSATVHIAFDEIIIPQLPSAGQELAQLTLHRNRWTMDVRNLLASENVNSITSVVTLGQSSNAQRRRRLDTLRSQASFSLSGTGGNRTFTQTTSPHEFGHMIGLGDEYLEDVSHQSIPTAVRGIINDRIQNVGETVTPDVYRPFADWLSDLTQTTWRVGRQIR